MGLAQLWHADRRLRANYRAVSDNCWAFTSGFGDKDADGPNKSLLHTVQRQIILFTVGIGAHCHHRRVFFRDR